MVGASTFMSFTNVRRRLCQPSLDVREISGSLSSRRHHFRTKWRDADFVESSGAGKSQPSPIDLLPT
jgi:hypothetical protein